MSTSVIDMKRGVYRRIYSGATHGGRINQVGDGAERLFWRLHMICDDFGNCRADPVITKASAMPLVARATPKRIQAWLDELVAVGLILTYDAGGDAYVHIDGFEDSQPTGYDKNRNARPRIQRHPLPNTKKNEAYEEIRSLRPENEDENEDENDTDTDTDTENEGGDSLPESAQSHSSSPSLSRSAGSIEYSDAVENLFGRRDGSRHPSGSAQFEADKTSAVKWWNDHIWPRDGDDDISRRRWATVKVLIPQAVGKTRPMGWLTDKLKRKGVIPK